MSLNKICHIFFDEYPKDSRVRRYCNALLENGYEVFVLSIHSKGEEYIEHSKHLHIYRVPIAKRRSTFVRRIFEYVIFEIIACIFSIWVFLIRGVKIFQFHTLPDFLVFSAVIPKIFGAKIILDFHELFPEFMQQLKPSLSFQSLPIKILKVQEKWSYKFADEVLVFHDPAKEILQSRIPSKKIPTVIMNGIDELEMPILKPELIGIKRIVYNGTINFNLNLKIVMLALSQIRDKRPDVFEKIEYHLYGDGPELEPLLAEAEKLNLNNVKYRGRMKFRDMMEELRFAWVCILPPKRDIYSELFYSLKLVEMIYLRIPVIASRLRTYVHYYPEDCLIYFEPDNVDDLVKKIISLFDNGSLVEPLKERAFEQYKKVSWNIMLKRYLDVVDKVKNSF